jgi:glycosyltransferase involved in cell wall biosynthesis
MRKTRIGLVRGPFLNPYDMAPYRHLGHGFEVIALAARRCFTESDGTGVEVRRLACLETAVSVAHGKRIHYLPWFFGYGYWLLGLRRAMRDIDVIHTADTYFGFSLQAARLAEATGRPLVVTAKETVPDVERAHPIRKYGRDAAVKAEVRQVARLYLAVSELAAAALQYEGVAADHIRIVPPAVDAGAFVPRPKQDSNHLRILFVGPALWRKGVLDAVRALGVVLRERPAIMTIVGTGADLREALRIAGRLGILDSIRVVPFAPYAEMPRYYQEADVLLAPSIATRTWQEQDSMAVLEAMSCQLPVIATPGGIRRELLGVNGYWVAPGDFLDIGERVIDVANAPDQAALTGAVLRRRVLERHDLPVVALQLASCYESILGGNVISATPKTSLATGGSRRS